MTLGAHESKPDFFERLIDQALGVDGAIAPRLRSLFEPAPQAAMAPEWQEETSAPDAMADAFQDDSPLPPSSPRAAPVRAPQQDIAPPARDAPPTPVHEPQQDTAASRREVRPKTAKTARSRAPTPVHEPQRDTAPPALEVPPRTATTARLRAPMPVAGADEGEAPAAALPLPAHVEAAVLLPHHVEIARAPPAEPAPLPVSPTPARRRDRSAPAPALLPSRSPAADAAASPQLVPDARMAVERIFLTPPPASRQQRPDDRRDHDWAEPAAPTVNITIGRVEVRAVTAPAAKPRAEARGPQPLGLDEYLKRRGAR
jgi:hypothetical protein